MKEAYINLVFAIVVMAVNDWRAAVQALWDEPRNKHALAMKEETEEFFQSDRFWAMTKVNGSALLRLLKKEAEAARAEHRMLPRAHRPRLGKRNTLEEDDI